MDVRELAFGIEKGRRRAVARALTLVESSLPEHETLSLQLFQALGEPKASYRLGVTGPPGAGKSTMIEQIVLHWVERGERVAILAVDPTSSRTGGSLLGDKTRMGQIAQLPQVLIRPSPTGTHLGGLGRRTPLMCSLLERAGYSRIVVETVGVGQSEISASQLVDCLLLVALPGAGDEVQGLKRGLMEEVDLVAVNKADLLSGKASVANLRSALRVLRREVDVLSVSAHTGEGLAKLFAAIDDRLKARGRGSELRFLEEFLAEAVLRKLSEQSPQWRELRDKVAKGESDLLHALPELNRLIAGWVDHL